MSENVEFEADLDPVYSEVPLDGLGDHGLQCLLDYWQAARQGRRMPRRRDIDPQALKVILPEICVIDVERDPLDFRYRLAGTAVYEIHRMELTGRRVTELQPPRFAQQLWRLMERLVEERAPHCTRWSFVNRLGVPRHFDVLRTPLSEDGETVSQILLVANHGSDAGTAQRPAGRAENGEADPARGAVRKQG